MSRAEYDQWKEDSRQALLKRYSDAQIDVILGKNIRLIKLYMGIVSKGHQNEY